MDALVPRTELGQFLKTRRAELSPSAVGLPDTGSKRRVPGLRREEVAQLASISVQYYTRVEQGRLQASAPVLATLARVLQMDDAQREYLFDVAGKDISRPRPAKDQQVRGPIRHLLDTLTDTPAFVLGRRMDILAWNPLAAALIIDFGVLPARERNYVRILFTEPLMRDRYTHWATHAHDCVAFLRKDAARNPDDPKLAALVGELSVKSPEFRTLWASHHVAYRAFGAKTIKHPVAGEITLGWEALASASDPDQQLVVWTAEPDSPSHAALKFLASWTTRDSPLRTSTNGA